MTKKQGEMLRILKMFQPLRDPCAGVFGNTAEVAPDGVSGVAAFLAWESQGKRLPTTEPEVLSDLNARKTSMDYHIKTWKEDLADYLKGGHRWAAIQLLGELARKFPVTWLDRVGLVRLVHRTGGRQAYVKIGRVCGSPR